MLYALTALSLHRCTVRSEYGGSSCADSVLYQDIVKHIQCQMQMRRNERWSHTIITAAQVQSTTLLFVRCEANQLLFLLSTSTFFTKSLVIICFYIFFPNILLVLGINGLILPVSTIIVMQVSGKGWVLCS